MSLRMRLATAMLLAVTIAVGATSASHIYEVERRMRSLQEQQAKRVATAIEKDLQQTRAVLDEELKNAKRGRFLSLALGGTGRGRYLAAKDRLRHGRLELLKVLDDKGGILISGAWPASWGALDANANLYQQPPGTHPRVVDEATPRGTAQSLQRWTHVQRHDKRYTVVAGRFLDEDALDDMRARVGADLLALCRPREQRRPRRCIAAVDGVVRDVYDPTERQDWSSHFLLNEVFVAPGSGASPSLVVGLDRTSVDQLSQTMVRRAALVGGGAFLIAVLLGIAVASRLARPVEALATAAEALSQGRLDARVPPNRSASREVDALVASFNQMAEDIEASQSQLKRAERVAAWREIARGLAHELKNPLTPIRGAMDVIRKAHALGRDDFDEILDEQAGAVVEEVDRLKELSDAFARFARLPDPQPESLDLAALLDNAVHLYVDTDRIDVERDVPETPLLVEADRTQMATAFTNLVKNAVEAMVDADSDQKTLCIRVHDDDTHVVVGIEDSGPGISDDMKDRLFTPYATTKGSRGTGLGLALVHRIVVEHEGSIHPGTSPAGGASFSIRLPKAASSDDGDEVTSTQAEA